MQTLQGVQELQTQLQTVATDLTQMINNLQGMLNVSTTNELCASAFDYIQDAMIALQVQNNLVKKYASLTTLL